MIIHTNIKKSKPKNTKKARDLRESFSKLLLKYETNGKKSTENKQYRIVLPRTTEHIKSLNSNLGTACKSKIETYSGNNMLGISTLHKSNSIPVFRQEDAIDIARMRR